MTVTLPIEDPTPVEDLPPELAEVAAMPGPGAVSLTQRIVEDVMKRDFPTVAADGIDWYVHRLSRIIYTTGFQVFWLDRLPDLPGYTLCALEAPMSVVSPEGLMVNISYTTGPAAARRAEEVRRQIPPGQTHN